MAVVPSIRVRVQTRPKVRIRVTPALIPANATVGVGNVVTGAAGSPVTITNVGTPSAVVLDFSIPKGDQGAAGVVQAIVAGANVTVDNTDPAHPVVESTGAPLDTTIHAATSKVTPVDADEMPITDSDASFGLKKLTWANLKEGIRAFLYGTNKVTPVDSDPVGILDSATSFSPKYSTWAQIKAFLFNSPTLVTPTLGVAAATSINKVAITAPASGATLTIPNGVTLTGPAASGTAMTLGNAETVSGVKTFSAIPVLSGGGIKFPATDVPSADPNTFDDYEEGTWTPAPSFTTPGTSSFTLSNQAGTYTKKAREVTLSFSLQTSAYSAGTASGSLQVTGSPFTNSASGVRFGSLSWDGITKASYTQVNPRMVASSAVVTFLATGSGQVRSQIAVADVAPAAGVMTLNGTMLFEV